MTDGIIQELFRDYHANNIITVSQLEKKLIEKIKQEADFNHYRFRTNTPIGISLRKLIGDNQE